MVVSTSENSEHTAGRTVGAPRSERVVQGLLPSWAIEKESEPRQGEGARRRPLSSQQPVPPKREHGDAPKGGCAE